jgi:hypothetical protein
MATSEEICKEVEEFYKGSYAAAFSREDVVAISKSFGCPCAWISGQQGLGQVATETEVQRMLGNFLTDLKERGWVRSQLDQLKIWPLAEDLAMLLGDVTRYKADGSVLERVRGWYTVRRDAQNWKIVTISEVRPPFLGPGDLPR